MRSRRTVTWHAAAVIGMTVSMSIGQVVTEPLAAGLSDLLTKSGDDYKAARVRFARLEGAKACLEKRITATKDPVERIVLRSVMNRIASHETYDAALDAAWRAAYKPGIAPHVPGVGEREPRADLAAAKLMHELGNEAAPLAAETLVKGLADGWEEWKQTALLCVLGSEGRQRIGHRQPRGTHSRPAPAGTIEVAVPTDPRLPPMSVRYSPVKNADTGWVLLWVAEHSENPEVSVMAGGFAQSFVSPDLLDAARIARDRITSEKKRKYFEGLVRVLEHEQRRLGQTQEVTTRPAASGPVE